MQFIVYNLHLHKTVLNINKLNTIPRGTLVASVAKDLGVALYASSSYLN